MTEAVFVAASEMRKHPIRTLLTVSGVAIAVATVVGVGSLLGAARTLMDVALRDAIGPHTIVVFYRDVTDEGARSLPNPLGIEDSHALRSLFPRYVSATSVRLSATLPVRAAATHSARVSAVEASAAQIAGRTTVQGRFILPEEVDGAAPVAVISKYAATTLFARRPALGSDLRIGDVRFRVIGVLSDAGALEARQLEVFIPVTTARFRLPETAEQRGTSIFVGLNENVPASALRPALIEVLRRRHPGYRAEHFEVTTPDERRARADRALQLVGAIFAIIALLCLITGGIGIMNVLLTSVSERVREIGMRRAVGATRRNVFTQFLIESLSFTTTGAIVGAAGGLGVGAALSFFANALLHSRGGVLYQIQPSLHPGLLALALVSSAFTGIVFGLYPALRASMINPADALRTE
jgi:ABC-type antimicrobial peptide transport system permease subunit